MSRKVVEAEVKKLAPILGEVTDELIRAKAKFPPMHSAHEGYAVLLEEVDELWEQVKLNPAKRNVAEMRKEAIQIAAMALRFIEDVCDSKPESGKLS